MAFGLQTVSGQFSMEKISTYYTDVFDEGSVEIVAYDPITFTVFFTNADANTIGVLDISIPEEPTLVTEISQAAYGGGVNSVAVKNGMVAVAVEAEDKTQNGRVVFWTTKGEYISDVEVGALPDMLTFTSDGSKVLVANEGEPNDDYTVDPEGSVSIIDLSNGAANATVQTISVAPNMTKEELAVQGIRIFGPNASVAQDLEPEYIAVSDDDSRAFVVCQENNALAVIDIENVELLALIGLGFKDHSVMGNGLDASNRDNAINIQTYPIVGMYQPDAITYYSNNGVGYILSANEGDARDYDGYSEEARVKDLVLDSMAYPNAAVIQADSILGRLNTTLENGDTDGDGDVDLIHAYGARSFSVWSAEDGSLVWDSGDEFEQYLAANYPDNFNATNDENDFDGRSDDKGPEPEAITVATVDGVDYALIGLERIGGIMVYDITDPASPSFVSYYNNRDFSADPESREVGDLGIEDIKFIPAAQSPTRQDLILTGNEVSGTLTLIAVNPREKDIIFDEEINITDFEPTIVVAPPSPLQTEVIFVGGHDVVQTTAHYGNPAGQAIAKEWHDFIGFTPDTTGESMGWVTVNHEQIYRDDRMGDGGGMTAFRVAKSADGGIDVVEQELEDGRQGHFFNVDFANTVGETGMNCGGIIGPNGRIWTAEEWFRGNTNSIWNSSARTSSLPYRVAGLTTGFGVRDTAQFTINAPEFPQVDGKTIDKFQNFNYMTEVDPRQARAIRKQYNWGRAGWEGGAITNDGKYVYLGIDGVPAPWVRFTADTPFDFTQGTLEVYKHDNPVGQRWIEVPMDNDDNIFGGLTDYAWSVGATMYMRNEWVVIDRETGIVYWTETGRDSGSSGPGIVYNALTSSTNAVTAPHHEALARQRGHASATDVNYQDYYGRVLYYDPATEEVGVTIEGGPYYEQSPTIADYPSTHLSNPDGLSMMTIDGQNFLLICEDLNGRSFGRAPEGINNSMCELFLLDARIKNATVNDLVRVTAIPRGAEVTGAVQIDANTVLFNSQHPNPNNPFPYNHSLTMAIYGFEGVTLDGLKNGSDETGLKVNQVSRQVHMNAKSDYAIYDGEGKRKKVYRNTDQFSIADLEAGKYMVLSADDKAYELIVQ
jgi:secreted PhoX family phosphatase